MARRSVQSEHPLVGALLGALGGRRRTWRHRVLSFAVATAWWWGLWRRVTFRYRALLRPVFLLAGLLLVRWWAAFTAPATVAVVTLLGCGAVVFHLRHRLDRRPEWVYAVSCLVAVEVGATATSAVGGGSRALNVVCVLAWAVGAVVWWAHHPVGAAAVKPPILDLWDAHIGMKEDGEDDIITRWRSHIG